ncbi:MAG: polysaccharide pyruvyl transferase family protein [Candidatus Helarchaeota archaeon]
MEKKKVGIFTFQDAENFGGALQAYGLQETVRKLGVESEIINYKNKGVLKRNFLKTAYYLSTFQPAIKRAKSFSKFKEKNFRLSKERIYKVNDLDKISDRYDYFLFGSDQIWNPKLANGFDDIYLGNFRSTAKKISYAASLGINELNNDEVSILNQKIRNLDSISVREENMIPMLNKEAEVVLDPTLLLEAEDWKPLVKKAAPDHDFIYVYQLHNNRNLDKFLQEFASQTNLNVLMTSPYIKLRKYPYKKVNEIGPANFLDYIDKSKFVVTDSFHGVIFSILFKKPFFTFIPLNRGERIKNLLQKLSLLHRIDISIDSVNLIIDYEETHRILEQLRNNSINFLISNLS